MSERESARSLEHQQCAPQVALRALGDALEQRVWRGGKPFALRHLKQHGPHLLFARRRHTQRQTTAADRGLQAAARRMKNRVLYCTVLYRLLIVNGAVAGARVRAVKSEHT